MATAPADIVGRDRQERSALSERYIVITIWLFALSRVVIETIGQTQVFSFGFYTFHIVDLPITFSAVTAIVCLISNGFEKRLLAVPAITIAFILCYNLVSGTLVSSAPALLWARDCISIGLLILIGVSAGRNVPVQKIQRALVCAAVILAMLALLRLVTAPNLFMINGWSAAETNDGGRPLSAQGTFMMVLPAIWLWSDVVRSPRWSFNLKTCCAAALPVVILATRQGTASISLIVGLAVILLIEPSHNRLIRAFASIGVGVALSLFAVLVVPLLSDQLNLQQRTANLGTRQAVWAALNELWPELPLHTQTFGFAAGQMPILTIQLQTRFSEWHASVHSMYYQMLVISGYVGLASYCLLIAGLFVVCLYRTVRSQMPAYPFANCVVTALLGYSYDVRSEQLLGVLVAIWWTNSKNFSRNQ